MIPVLSHITAKELLTRILTRYSEEDWRGKMQFAIIGEGDSWEFCVKLKLKVNEEVTLVQFISDDPGGGIARDIAYQRLLDVLIVNGVENLWIKAVRKLRKHFRNRPGIKQLYPLTYKEAY